LLSSLNDRPFSAMIKEDITVHPSKKPEYRFKVIAFSLGTSHEKFCCTGCLCEDHSVSLCYNATLVYFQTKFEKMQIKKTFTSTLFNLTKDGYVVNPDYKFILLTSQPPCGFMSDDKKHILSWKMPFDNQPHIPTCSSRILINSYLGIQGSLTILFAQPVYISDIIMLNFDDDDEDEDEDEDDDKVQAKNCKPTDCAVLKNINIKFEEFKKHLHTANKFCFCKPKITIHHIQKDKNKMHQDKLTVHQSNTSPNYIFCLRDEIGNEGQLKFSDQNEKKVQELWKCVKDNFMNNPKLLSQFQHYLKGIKEALVALSSALNLTLSIQEAKKELEDRIKHNEKMLEEDFTFINKHFENLCIKEREYKDTQLKENDMFEKLNRIPDIFLKKKDNLAMLKSLNQQNPQNSATLYDCTWDEYYSVMKEAVDSLNSQVVDSLNSQVASVKIQ